VPRRQQPKGELRSPPASAFSPAATAGRPSISKTPIKACCCAPSASGSRPEDAATGKQLAAKDIDTLAKWIKLGCHAQREYWAYQPVRRPALPAVRCAWVSSPIDAFILAKLEAKGLTPAGPADKVALLRRACYDLTGLPRRRKRWTRS